MYPIGIEHYLVLGALVFSLGILVMVIKRNAIGILIGVELVLNAANLNLVAFSRYQVGEIDGQVTALFVIVLAAAVHCDQTRLATRDQQSADSELGLNLPGYQAQT